MSGSELTEMCGLGCKKRPKEAWRSADPGRS
jgi:hypothetical protein